MYFPIDPITIYMQMLLLNHLLHMPRLSHFLLLIFNSLTYTARLKKDKRNDFVFLDMSAK